MLDMPLHLDIGDSKATHKQVSTALKERDMPAKADKQLFFNVKE